MDRSHVPDLGTSEFSLGVGEGEPEDRCVDGSYFDTHHSVLIGKLRSDLKVP